MGPSPLALDGWLEFNRRRWKLEPLRLRFPGPDAEQPNIEAVVYVDKRGRICNPPRNPYLPVRFQSTPTNLRHRQTRQWLEVSEQLATEMRQRGLRNTVNLPPQVTDIRPWQWAGFRVSVRFTMFLDLPLPPNTVDTALARIWRKAEKEGFRCDRTTNMADVAACLASTEERQDFQLGVSKADLDLAATLLGPDHLRAYICYAPNGEPASTAVALYCPGGSAIGWMSGTRKEFLRSGPAQLISYYHFEDVGAAGATRFDLCGANMPTIAASKTSWGGQLAPYYTVESYDSRRMVRWTLDWWRYRQEARAR